MILILGGTSDSLEICKYLNEKNIEYIISVTTSYGFDLAKKYTNNIILNKLTIEDMVEFIQNKNITKVIDATHPYATQVSENAIESTSITNIKYIRFERESLLNKIEYQNKYIVDNIDEACEIANKIGKNIFIGTGSKNLHLYKQNIKNKNLICRVLPTSEVIESCEKIGFNADNIIAMKGPFSIEINCCTYSQYNIDLVITKESGQAGGFIEKIKACENLDIPVIIMKRKQINYPNVIQKIEDIQKLI